MSKGIESIGERAFRGCSKLTTVNFHGTEEDFKSISIKSENEYFKNATVNYIED